MNRLDKVKRFYPVVLNQWSVCTMYITNNQRSVQRLSSWAANYKVGNIRFCESCGMQRPPHLFSSAVLAQLNKLDKIDKTNKIDKPARSHHFCNFMIPVSLWQTCFVWMTISKNSLIGAQELEETSHNSADQLLQASVIQTKLKIFITKILYQYFS